MPYKRNDKDYYSLQSGVYRAQVNRKGCTQYGTVRDPLPVLTRDVTADLQTGVKLTDLVVTHGKITKNAGLSSRRSLTG